MIYSVPNDVVDNNELVAATPADQSALVCPGADVIEFATTLLLPVADVNQSEEPIVIHITPSPLMASAEPVSDIAALSLKVCANP